MNNPLKYSNCWEDPILLSKYLEIDTNSKIISIASAGDNSLFLTSLSPKSIVCIDPNVIQLNITKLKEQTIRYLPYCEAIELLGFKESPHRLKIYHKIETYLENDVKHYFNSNLNLLKNGIVHQGKFENYLSLFAKKILPLIHNQKNIKLLLQNKSENEQINFYNFVWNNKRWKLIFKIFFSKYFMGIMGREPEKLKHVKKNVGENIFKKAENHLKSIYSQNNFILEYAITGNFSKNLPPYIQENNYKKIKSWLQKNQIIYEHSFLEECLKKYPDYNRFNLSDIFEYMTIEQFEKNIDILYQYCENKSIIAYWNLMVSREIINLNFENIEINDPDMGFFYDSFMVYKKFEI